MELYVLLEFLKLLWIGFEVFRHFKNRKREKALIESVKNLNQRLNQLESKAKEIP